MTDDAMDDLPDRNCVSLPDGSCIGDGCMHDLNHADLRARLEKATPAGWWTLKDFLAYYNAFSPGRIRALLDENAALLRRVGELEHECQAFANHWREDTMPHVEEIAAERDKLRADLETLGSALGKIVATEPSHEGMRRPVHGVGAMFRIACEALDDIQALDASPGGPIT